ncbi:MAG: BNR-4 repeat-containing protein [Mediterranea sp.]|nr:BNR-4 repeat-containing protein [Mediterranea sp.]
MATFTLGKGIPVNTITEKGAWCWFADPRSISFENKGGTIHSAYIGYIDVHGNIKATQINHKTGTTNEILVRSCFQPDDHNNPTFLVLPDERIMIFYSRHTDEPCFYYRVSQKPGDITTLGKEFRLETANNTTYPSPFILSDDPDHIYLCWRGIGWHPTIARLTIPDKNDEVRFDWGHFQVVRSSGGGNGVRPYAKYVSNGKNKIYLAYTTTHPDNRTSNWLYCSYIDINTRELKDTNGNVLSPIAEDKLHDIETTREYIKQNPVNVVDETTLRDWLWEIILDKDEKPVIAMVRISENKTAHEYYYTRWTGSEWRKTFLTKDGGHFHQTPGYEMCYSGGMTLDKANPNIVYASVPVNGQYGEVYELMKFTIGDNGEVTSKEQLTFDSQKNNVRPFVISNRGLEPQLAWMQGDYYSWIVTVNRPNGYPTAIRTNMEIPQGKVDIEKGKLLEKNFDRVSPENKHSLRISKSNSFSIIMNISIDSDAYFGEILKTNAFSYHLKEGDRQKPYFSIKNKEYESTNVPGTSDSWKTQSRGTDGKWHTPAKLKTFQLAITYEKGILKSHINGLIDQYIEVKGLSFSDITVGGHKGTVNDFRVFDRALSQDEIKAVHRDVIPKEEDMAGYLMVYFKDDTHGLYFALSNDGYSFTDMNNGKPVILFGPHRQSPGHRKKLSMGKNFRKTILITKNITNGITNNFLR